MITLRNHTMIIIFIKNNIKFLIRKLRKMSASVFGHLYESRIQSITDWFCCQILISNRGLMILSLR